MNNYQVKIADTKYKTLVDATNELSRKGYDKDYEIRENGLFCLTNEKTYQPKEVKIVEVHRFEGYTNPADNSILFAIENTDGTKGMIVSAYGPYMDQQLAEFLDNVEVVDRGDKT